MANAQQRDCYMLYGSATGNSEEIARALSEEASDYGIVAQFQCMDQYKKAELKPGSVCVFVVSTTGEGEAPENASRFMRTIKRKTQAATMFEGISFTVCGLGDTNYSLFCNTGKLLNKRLVELSADKFYKECEADEGVGGLEQFIEPWKAGLWGPLRIALGMDNAKKEEAAAPALPLTPRTEPAPAVEAPAAAAVPVPAAEAAAAVPCRLTLAPAAPGGDASAVARSAVAAHNGAALFVGAPTAARRLTAEDALKQVWHMQLDISAAGLAEPLQPGDAVGVLVPNADAEVAALCERLGCDGSASVTVGTSEVGGGLPSHLPAEACTVSALLSLCCDLRSVARKSLLKGLGACCTTAAEADALTALASKEGKADYAAQILAENPTLTDLLAKYPSCKPPVELLLDLLPPLAPRYYSLSSSPLCAEGPSSVGFAFTVVEYTSPAGVTRTGLATTYLAGLAAALSAPGGECGTTLACFAKPTPSFRYELSHSLTTRPSVTSVVSRLVELFDRLPEDPATPCVLIGPGTGVAPFVGFAQHRLAQAEEAAKGKLELYFGCREEAKDYLYKDTLEAATAGGALGRLVTAFSREQEEKVYVQDRLKEDGARVATLLLKEGGRVYVCGDGGAMFKVRTTLHYSNLRFL